ncbi:hypothetical protein GCM10009682_16950 [Luedemannella flava]|uniref:Acyl-CoA dehydrogenase C-terminal domain-containing protein n=1 Tax=Luedemannella flava TaxID=349316 RepID=A0ABN2LPD7_9ACTN
MGTLDDDTTGLAPVTVDPDGVHGFGAFVQDEVTHNLHPYAEDIVRLCDDDAVAFGNRLAFPALYDARTGYEASLRQAIGNLREFVTASQIIVDAVKKITSEYAAADGLASTAVKKILDDALTEAARQRRAHDEMVRIAGAHVILPTSVTEWGDPL